MYQHHLVQQGAAVGVHSVVSNSPKLKNSVSEMSHKDKRLMDLGYLAGCLVVVKMVRLLLVLGWAGRLAGTPSMGRWSPGRDLGT